MWAQAWFGVRHGIDWDQLRNYHCISEASLHTIDANELEGEDSDPFTNEIAERVFRMTSEKLNHCKSVAKLEKQMKIYFNCPSTRLN